LTALVDTDDGIGRCLDDEPILFLAVTERLLRPFALGDVYLASRCREITEVCHQAQVFHVETATVVMGDDPDRRDGFAVEAKGDQQSLVDKRRHRGEMAEMAFRMRNE
jgi:hypothetical protein